MQIYILTIYLTSDQLEAILADDGAQWDYVETSAWWDSTPSLLDRAFSALRGA